MCTKYMVFNCDKCGAQNVWVAYSPLHGCYCEKCLREAANKTIEQADLLVDLGKQSTGFDTDNVRELLTRSEVKEKYSL